MKQMEKYSDDYNPNEEQQIGNNIFIKIFNWILQVFFGILVGCISIVILPFLILWFVFCIILKKEPALRLKGYSKNKPLIKTTING